MSSETKNYTYDNSGRLIKEYITLKYSDGETITRSIVYLYDESDVVGMAYTNNGSTEVYYFNKNTFGDVIEILDISGNIVVRNICLLFFKAQGRLLSALILFKYFF